MSSSGLSTPRARRAPAARRAEILDAARALALSDGLEQVTLRSVAERTGVTGSLVSHYFPAVDDLLAELFAVTAGAELEQVFDDPGGLGPHDPAAPADRVTAVLRRLVEEKRDAISVLWIDAWHVGRRRPALRREVDRLTAAWIDRLAGLVDAGRADGVFASTDPHATAVRVMAVVDGLAVQCSLRGTLDHGYVEQLVFSVAEAELGLRPGRLR